MVDVIFGLFAADDAWHDTQYVFSRYFFQLFRNASINFHFIQFYKNIKYSRFE